MNDWDGLEMIGLEQQEDAFGAVTHQQSNGLSVRLQQPSCYYFKAQLKCIVRLSKPFGLKCNIAAFTCLSNSGGSQNSMTLILTLINVVSVCRWVWFVGQYRNSLSATASTPRLIVSDCFIDGWCSEWSGFKPHLFKERAIYSDGFSFILTAQTSP